MNYFFVTQPLTQPFFSSPQCEVSGEAPSFKTKFDSEDMVVVVTPSKAEIVGAHPKYLVGDTVNVTCISTGFDQCSFL